MSDNPKKNAIMAVLASLYEIEKQLREVNEEMAILDRKGSRTTTHYVGLEEAVEHLKEEKRDILDRIASIQ